MDAYELPEEFAHLQSQDMSKIGLNIAVCLITILYGVAINILLLPISAKLEVKIAEYMHK